MGHETVARIAELPPGYVGSLSVDQLVTINPTLACGECPACAAGRANNCTTGRVIGVASTISSAFPEYMAVPVGTVVPLRPSMPPEHGSLLEPPEAGRARLRGRGWLYDEK